MRRQEDSDEIKIGNETFFVNLLGIAATFAMGFLVAVSIYQNWIFFNPLILTIGLLGEITSWMVLRNRKSEISRYSLRIQGATQTRSIDLCEIVEFRSELSKHQCVIVCRLTNGDVIVLPRTSEFSWYFQEKIPAKFEKLESDLNMRLRR